MNKLNVQVFLNIYNVFDIRDETRVYTDTGTAEYSTYRNPDKIPVDPLRIGSVQDNTIQPSWYTPPREIQLGFAVIF